MEARRRGANWVCLECDLVLEPPNQTCDEASQPQQARARGTGPPDDYIAWNDALAAHFFNTRAAGKPVYLDIEGDVLDAVSKTIGTGGTGSPRDDFLAAVRSTLGRGRGLLARHADWLAAWDGKGPPPVVAVLALASMAAEDMGADAEVASHNYYVPFARLIGIADSDYPAISGAMKEGYRKHIGDLWKALNGWLEDHEGSLGLPTARTHGHNTHIAYALGQALVREADRARLPDFFSYFRLRPGQEVEPERMLGLLDRWVPTGTLSAKIRGPWDTNDALRTALADVACAELLSWDGTRRHGEQGDRLDVRLAVISRRRTGDRIVLHVTGTEGPPPGGLVVGRLQQSPSWTRVGDASWVDSTTPAAVLLAEPVLVGSGHEPHRTAKKVNVFAREGGLWIESSHIEPGEPHIVVVDSDLHTAHALIDTRARNGFARSQAGDGWTVYKGVVIDSPLDAVELPPLLQPLGTVARRSLALVGGLRLPNRPPRWHLHSPPVVSIADPPVGKYTVSISGPTHTELGPFEGPSEIDLREVDGLGPGRHTVRVGDSEATLILRTSDDEASHHLAHPSPALDRSTDATLGMLVAQPAQGRARVAPNIERTSLATISPSATIPWERVAPATVQDGTHLGIGDREDLGSRSGSSHPPCTAGGPCRLYIPPGVKRLRHQPPCVYCGLRKGEREKFTATIEAMLAEASGDALTRRRVERPTIDAIVDGILHARGGKLGHLHEWLGRSGLDGLARYELLRDLVALGAIDIARDTRDGQPWRHLPLTLVSHAEDHSRWLATGLVTPTAIAAIELAAAELGGEVIRRAARDGDQDSMSLVEIRGLGAAEVADLDGFLDADVEPDGGRRIATGLRPLRRAVSAFGSSPLPNSAVGERFEPITATFGPEGRLDEDGLYRVEVGYRRQYWWVEDGRRTTLPNGDSGKLLAAAYEGKDLIAYLGRALVLPLGCRLPGLYERAVVLSSFNLPVTRSGVVAYENVPADVAELVYTALTTTGEQ